MKLEVLKPIKELGKVWKAGDIIERKYAGEIVIPSLILGSVCKLLEVDQGEEKLVYIVIKDIFERAYADSFMTDKSLKKSLIEGQKNIKIIVNPDENYKRIVRIFIEASFDNSNEYLKILVNKVYKEEIIKAKPKEFNFEKKQLDLILSTKEKLENEIKEVKKEKEKLKKEIVFSELQLKKTVEEIKRLKEAKEEKDLMENPAGDTIISRDFMNEFVKASRDTRDYKETEEIYNGKMLIKRERKISRQEKLALYYPTGTLYNPDLDSDTMKTVLFIYGKARSNKSRKVSFTKGELLKEIGHSDKEINRGGNIHKKAKNLMDRIWNSEWVIENKEQNKLTKIRLVSGVSEPLKGKKGAFYEVVINYDITPKEIIERENIDYKELKGNYITIPEKLRKDRALNQDEHKFCLKIQALRGIYKTHPINAKTILRDWLGKAEKEIKNRKKYFFILLLRVFNTAKNKGYLDKYEIANKKEQGDIRKCKFIFYPTKKNTDKAMQVKKEVFIDLDKGKMGTIFNNRFRRS